MLAFCPHKIIDLPLTPSYINGQRIQGFTNTAFEGVLGTDLTSLQDPRVTVDGLKFEGGDVVTVENLNLNRITFTLALWLWMDSTFSSLRQTIVSATGSPFTLEVEPFNEILYFNQVTGVSKTGMFGRSDHNSSSGLVGAFDCWIIQTQLYSLLNSILNELTQNFKDSEFTNTGCYNFFLDWRKLPWTDQRCHSLFCLYVWSLFLRQFSMYSLSLLVSRICPIGMFFDDSLSSCQCILNSSLACHPLCTACRDSNNHLCGWCRSPASLITPQVPGTCFECHDSCSSCDGPLPSGCLTCLPGFIQMFTNGGSGECKSSCNEISSQQSPPYNQCPDSSLQIQTSLSVQRVEQVSILVIHFSQPVLIQDLSPDQVKLEGEGSINSSDFQISFSPLHHHVTSTLLFQIHPSVSLSGEQVSGLQLKEIFLTLQNSQGAISSLASDFALPSVITPPSFSLPKTEHIDESTLTVTDIVSFSTQAIYTAEVITVLIVQSAFQASSGVFWAVINLDQLIFFLPLLNLSLPRIIFVVFRILSFAVGDIFILKLLYEASFGQFLDQPPFNPFSLNFLSADFESVQLIDSSSSFLMLLLLSFLVLLLLYLARSICGSRCASRGIGCCVFGVFLRLFLESFLQTFLFSFLNIQAFSTASLTQILSISLSFAFFLLFLLFPFLFIRVLARSPYELAYRKSTTYRKWNQIYASYRFNQGFLQKHYSLVFLLRRFVFIFALTLVQNPRLQLLLVFLGSLLESKLLWKNKPYKAQIDNKMSVINEVFFMIIIGLFWAVHELRENGSLRLILAWVAISLVSLINLLNLVVMTLVLFKFIKDGLSKRRKQIRAKQELQKKFPVRSRHNLSDSAQGLNQSTKVYPMSRFMVPFTRNQPHRELQLEKSTFNPSRPAYRERSQALDQVKLESLA